MKWLAVIMLFMIAMGVIVPPSLPILLAAHENAVIGSLDVCHSAAPAIASDGDMPCVSAWPCLPYHIAKTTSIHSGKTVFKPFLIVLQNERPPKA